MSDITLDEPKRTAVEIKPTTNTLGRAVAQFVVSFNNTQHAPSTIELIAYEVENDGRWGDHILIVGKHKEGENAGGQTTQEIIIHNAPLGITKHTVRFVNFGLEEHSADYVYGEVNKLVTQALAYLVFGEVGGW